jgi:putative ABC transport system ATP-binding protein
MNLLGALDHPNAGQIWFRDKDISKASESFRDDMRRKNIGFIFQSVALISMMSAYENVEFGLRVAGVKSRERRRRAEECLSLVGLAKRMHHRPQEMSGGEQQRVAIARAIAHRPDIVFADEPTAELDSHMGLQVMRLFKTLVEKEGLTVVITTHDPSMLEIADHAYTLEDGEIVDERKG